MVNTREENAAELAREEEVTVVVAPLRAALGQLLEQVYQMEGMFPDDEALQAAIKDAEEALEA